MRHEVGAHKIRQITNLLLQVIMNQLFKSNCIYRYLDSEMTVKVQQFNLPKTY